MPPFENAVPKNIPPPPPPPNYHRAPIPNCPKCGAEWNGEHCEYHMSPKKRRSGGGGFGITAKEAGEAFLMFSRGINGTSSTGPK